MAKARWVKWHTEAHLRPESEPKFERWFPLEFGIRDKRTGQVAWVDLRSVRDTIRRVSVVLKYYA